MTRKIVLYIFICMSFPFFTKAQSITVGSYNLRYDNPRDTGNLWVNRAPVVASLLQFHEFDIVGTQEGLINQLQDLERLLTGFAYYGAGRDDGQTKGEHSAIFYRKDRFELLDKGDFWLSATPGHPGPGWDARLNRICSWVELKDKTIRRRFYVFNVHFDHQGVMARNESSTLMLEKIKAIAGNNPVVFTGDFNGDHESNWYKTIAESGILKDCYRLSAKPYANNGSFNGFQENNPNNGIIDHIFVTSQFSVKRYGILTDTYHGRFPSDHFPVLVKLVLE